MPRKKIKDLDVTERYSRFTKEYNKLLDKYGFMTMYQVSFQKKKVPFRAKIAVRMLDRCGGTVHMKLLDKWRQG